MFGRRALERLASAWKMLGQTALGRGDSRASADGAIGLVARTEAD
jgi:hypothetical protein